MAPWLVDHSSHIASQTKSSAMKVLMKVDGNERNLFLSSLYLSLSHMQVHVCIGSVGSHFMRTLVRMYVNQHIIYRIGCSMPELRDRKSVV